jgi:hypothetical protein
LQLRVVDRTLIGLQRGLVLAHQRGLRIDLQRRDRILREQRAKALEVRAGAFQQRLIAGPLSDRQLQLHFERPRIDARDHVALLDELALLERHLHQLAIDAAAHHHRVARRDRPERVQLDLEIASPRLRDDDLGRGLRGSAAIDRALAVTPAAIPECRHGRRGHQHDHDAGDDAPIAPRRRAVVGIGPDAAGFGKLIHPGFIAYDRTRPIHHPCGRTGAVKLASSLQ